MQTSNIKHQTSNIKHQTLAILILIFFLSFFKPDTIHAQGDFSCGTVELPNDTIENNRGQQSYSSICTTGTKYLRVNYHFIQDDNGNGNMTETDDGGAGLSNMNGYEFAELFIEEANRQLSLNIEPWLKTPNETYLPLPEIPIRYVLSGVYFHQSTTARNASPNSWTYFDTNCINCDTEINIFDTNLGGANQMDGPSGIARTITQNIDLKVKIKNYVWYIDPGKGWAFALPHGAKNINHEIGHTLNLHHDHYNDSNPSYDGCLDTPGHNMCWDLNYPTNLSPCNISNPVCCSQQSDLSNNLMSYNNQVPPSLTYHQIDRINEKMARVQNIDYVYACDACPDWCSEEAPAYAFFETNQTTYNYLQTDNVFLNGQGSFNEDVYIIEICYLGNFNSTNQNCSSDPQPYSSGVLNGPITNIDLSNLYNFDINSRYKISLTVDNNNCPLQNTFSSIIKFGRSPNPICRINNINQKGDMAIAHFNIEEANEYNINVINIVNPSVALNLASNFYYNEGTYFKLFNTGKLPIGIYRIEIKPIQVDPISTYCSRKFFIK